MDNTILHQNECEEIQYILNDTEFVLSDIPTEDTDDILYSDGSQTYLVNGHLINDGEETLVFEEGEEISQLFINNESGDQNTSENQFINDSEFVQYAVEDESNSQILYLSEDSVKIESEESSQQLEENNPIDQAQLIELDQLFQQSENLSNQQGYQYAILKDGKLQIQSFENESVALKISPDEISDTSLITGKNLITGQKVSLENYIKKRQSGLVGHSPVKSSSRSRKTKLNSLLNRTFRLGARVNGKQLVGKVVQVKTNASGRAGGLQKNLALAEKNERPLTGATKSEPPLTYHQLTRKLKHQTVDENSETFRHLVRTLSGLVGLENAEARLSQNNLFIMVEERKMRTDKNPGSRRVYYAGGSLKPDEGGKWSFFADFLTRDSSEGKGHQNYLRWLFSHGKFSDAIKLKLMITHEKNNDTLISVMLDYEEDFPTAKQEPDEVENACDLCGENFENPDLLRDHRQWHQVLGQGGPADSSSQDGRPKISLKALAGLRDLPEKNYSTGRIFACNMCGRTFSRCTNLQRHMTVHHKGSGDTFQCEICGCSYHYVSSLTRHMVQNHIIGQNTNIGKQ